MYQYDVRQTFIEGLELYVTGIETDAGLLRLAKLVTTCHDALPRDACELVGAVLAPRDRFSGSYADAARALHSRLTGEPLTVGRQAA